MTTTNEKIRSIDNVREFLYRLMDRDKTHRVPMSIRMEARQLLKHYPSEDEWARMNRYFSVSTMVAINKVFDFMK